MILYINGSPKKEKSNSQFYINKINKNNNVIYLHNSFGENLDKYDTLVFSCPLYLDSPPSIVLKYFKYLQDNNVQNKYIYVISNCGFLESNNNDVLIDIFKSFCKESNNIYMGCLKLGAGEISGKCDKIKLYKLVNIPLYIKIRKFKNAINKKRTINLDTTIFHMTKKIYIFIANKSFKKKMK